MIDFGWPQIVVLVVAAQRLGELVLARHNTQRLLRDGGREIGAKHYRFLVVLHAGWLSATFALVPPDAPVLVPLLVAFAILQLLRVWVVASLGRYWTTRIITVPNAPLVKRGPYRFMRHPNYMVVIGEIALLPLCFGAWQIALFFSLLNLILLRHRIRIEDLALAARR